MQLLRKTGLYIILLWCSIFPVLAQDQDQLAITSTPSQQITVATREAAPFAMKNADGTWYGLSIDLWDVIAGELGIAYQFEEASLDNMIEGVANGRFDASTAAMTITPAREMRVDFSHPFYTTGFGIVTKAGTSSWISLMAGLFSWSFLQAVLILLGVLGTVGLLFWLVERKHNTREFGGSAARGIGSGLWFSAVTMTTVGYGDKAPKTFMGRIIALIWMFTAIIIISTFTGMIASSLTSDRLQSTISTPEDLRNSMTGSVKGSASDAFLTERGITFKNFDSVKDGLTAVEQGKIEAFVYDKPLLQYLVNISDNKEKLHIVAGTFGRQDYGIALPPESPLREDINQALLMHLQSDDWRNDLIEVFGKEE